MEDFLNITEANIEKQNFCVETDEIFYKGRAMNNICHSVFTSTTKEISIEKTFYSYRECKRSYNELDCSNATSFLGEIIEYSSKLWIQFKKDIPIFLENICNPGEIKVCIDGRVLDNDAEQINNTDNSDLWKISIPTVIILTLTLGVVTFLIKKKYRSSNTTNKSDADVESETPCLDKSHIKEATKQVSNDSNDNITPAVDNIQVCNTLNAGLEAQEEPTIQGKLSYYESDI